MPEHRSDEAELRPAEPIDDRPGEAELPAGVVAERQAADAQAKVVGPSIDAHVEAVLQNCRIALDALAAQHAYLADHSDMELDGAMRWASRWQLGDAAIAHAHALVDLSAQGHVDSALPVSRTLHEALAVLEVVNDEAEQTILDRWLDDREVQPKKIRAAAERQAQRVAEQASAQGIDLEVTGVKEHMEQMCSVLSDVSPIRRTGVRGMVSARLRRAVYGRHPDPVHRAAGAASTVLSVEATIIGVGDSLASFYGGRYYREVIKPIQDGLMKSATQLMVLIAA